MNSASSTGRQRGHLAAMQRHIEGQHARGFECIERVAQRRHGALGVQLESGFGGLLAQVAVTATEVAAQRGHVQQVDGAIHHRLHHTPIRSALVALRTFSMILSATLSNLAALFSDFVGLARTGRKLVALQHKVPTVVGLHAQRAGTRDRVRRLTLA